jgi:hypothetical protein
VTVVVRAFIEWAKKRARYAVPVVTFEGVDLFTRYEFLRRDEWPDSWWDEHRERYLKQRAEGALREGALDLSKRPNALPWWLPFNAFVHHWKPAPGHEEDLHDHPRWSITVCLTGGLIERTPWGERVLKPGSVVIRSRKAIHGFRMPEGCDEAWTLFIVGRRKYRQNTYQVVAR